MDRMYVFSRRPNSIFLECGSYFIKYCKTGETCNTLEATVSADLKAAPTSKPVRSTMKVQHTKCGPKNEDKGKFCDLMKEKVKKDVETFNKLPSSQTQIVENLVTTCDQGNVITCEKDCVDLNDHPEWKDVLVESPTVKPKDPNEQMSHGDVPKICTVLLAYPFLAHMI
jgi:hypothetical protein